MKRTTDAPTLVAKGTKSRTSEIIRFKLTGILGQCSEAAAVLLRPSGQSGSGVDSTFEETCPCAENRSIIVRDIDGVSKLQGSADIGWHSPIGATGTARESECEAGIYDVLTIGDGCCNPVDSDSGSETPCLAIAGLEMATVRTVTPAEVAWVLGYDANGCLIKFPINPCAQSGSG